jgi:hypothetical protein
MWVFRFGSGVVEVSVQTGCGSVLLGDWWPMFRDNAEVSSSGVKMSMNISMWTFILFKMRPPVCLKTLGTNYPATECNIPEQRWLHIMPSLCLGASLRFPLNLVWKLLILMNVTEMSICKVPASENNSPYNFVVYAISFSFMAPQFFKTLDYSSNMGPSEGLYCCSWHELKC